MRLQVLNRRFEAMECQRLYNGEAMAGRVARLCQELACSLRIVR